MDSRKKPKKKSQKTRRPTTEESMEEFRVQTRNAFDFLVREFGFQEEPIPLHENKNLNPFAVWFVSPTTRVVIEGTNWGMNARVALGRAGPSREFENYDFLDLLATRSESESGVQFVTGAQLDQVRQYAALLPDAAADVLRGDHSIFAELAACVERRRAEYRRRYFEDTEV
jgi:hypothetical protein